MNPWEFRNQRGSEKRIKKREKTYLHCHFRLLSKLLLTGVELCEYRCTLSSLNIRVGYSDFRFCNNLFFVLKVIQDTVVEINKT